MSGDLLLDRPVTPPVSFKLSQEIIDSLLSAEHRPLFQPLLDLSDPARQTEPLPTRPKARDPEARAECLSLAEGGFQCTLVLPIDDNAGVEDGRLYLRDTFVYDSSGMELRSFQRKFSGNGRGGENWSKYLQAYASVGEREALTSADPRVRALAARLAPLLPRPVAYSDEGQVKTLPKIRAAFQREHDYLATLTALASEAKAGLKFLIKDERNYYTVQSREESFEILFQWAMDFDAEAENGRILVRDKFTLDPRTLRFRKISREWLLAPEAAQDAAFSKLLKTLSRSHAPDAEEAARFIENLLPTILPESSPKAPVLFRASNKPELSRARARLLREGGPEWGEASRRASLEALAALEVVVQEQFARRGDGVATWIEFPSWTTSNDIAQIFAQASLLVKEPNLFSPREAFEALPWSWWLGHLRDAILKSPTLAAFDELGREYDHELRWERLRLMAKEALVDPAGLTEFPAWVSASQRDADPSLPSEVVADLADIQRMARGEGDFSQKIERILPRFAGELSRPSSLAAMTLAPLAGAGVELGLLRALRPLVRGTKPLTLGLTAGAGGIAAEGFAFTLAHRSVEALTPPHRDVWTGFSDEWASSVVLFSALRLSNFGVTTAALRAAEGKWGLGGRVGVEVFPAAAAFTPTGRAMVGAFGFRAGGGVPRLNGPGAFLHGLLRPSAGILGFQAAGYLSRWAGWEPESDLRFGMHLLDSATLYLQAMMGANLVGRLTGGRLQAALGEMKWRMEEIRRPTPEFVDPQKAAPIVEAEALRLIRLNPELGLRPESRLGIRQEIARRLATGEGLWDWAEALQAERRPIFENGRISFLPAPPAAQVHQPTLRLLRQWKELNEADFETLWRMPKRQVAHAILEHDQLRPILQVKAGAYDFYLSRILRVENSEGDKRLYALALVPVEEGGRIILKRRFFYKSNSDAGNWRACPYQAENGHLKKGVGVHYTQETQPVPELAEALIYLEQRSQEHYSMTSGELWPFISIASPMVGPEGLRTMAQAFGEEVAFPRIAGMTDIQELGDTFRRPRNLEVWTKVLNSHILHEKSALEVLEALEYPQGFVPDFRREPRRTFTQPESLLGPVTFREYTGGYVLEKVTGRHRPVVWTMGEDTAGRVWVQSIRYADASVNSYGVYSEVIDSGLLTAKPLEYKSQTTALPESHRPSFDEHYDDVSSALALLRPIREYRQARGLGAAPVAAASSQ